MVFNQPIIILVIKKKFLWFSIVGASNEGVVRSVNFYQQSTLAERRGEKQNVHGELFRYQQLNGFIELIIEAINVKCIPLNWFVVRRCLIHLSLF